MEEVFHVLEEDNTERFIPVRRAAEYAKDMRDAGKTFKYLEDWKGKDGETIPVAPERREEFLADMKAQGVTPERVRPITRDGRRVYHLSDGEQFEVAAHREEEFFSDMEAAGREVVRDEPAVDFLSDEEADDALSGGIDWAEVGKSAAQGWKFPVRLAMNVAEGAVAIPTLAVMAGEYGLAKAGVLEEGEHPLGKHGLKAMRAIEGAKPEYRLDTGSESWRDPSGIVHNVASGSLGALEFLGEIAATAGLSGAVKTVAKKGVKEGAKQIGKEVASGVLRVAQELPSKTIKGVAKRVAREAAEGAVFEGATATAGVAGRSMATEAENRAARKAAETLGIASLDVTDWAAATAFAEAYARQLPRELLKEGSKRFAKQALKPNYWKLNMVSRNALETYEAFASTGSDEDKAMLNALGDGALGYLLLSLGDGAGAFSGGLRAGGATQLLRALTQGASKPWLKAELAGTAIRMLGGATAQGGSTYGHLRMLQEALGEDAVDDDTLRGSTVVAGVFGAGMGALSSIIPIRQAIAYDKELALGRQAMADGGPAWRPSEGQRGWARLDFPEGGTRQDGMPGAQSPAPFRPVAVHESGDVLFKDGSIWRAKTQDWLMPGGAVVDSHGDVVTVAPGMRGASTGDARREHRATGQNGAEDLGLFELIRSGETKVYNVPLAEIQPNTQIIQFKADADPVTGVVRGQELQGEYQALPSKPVLLWQAADGHLEPATGRHRIDLARRNGMETIPANIIREADGWTPERTRLLDAMDNILDEKGSDQDFVAFFRGTDLDRETAKRKGLLARKKGRDAFEVAKNGSEDLYSLVMGHDPWVTMDKAAAISREAPKTYGAFAEGVQRAVVKAVRERNLTADGAAIMARGLMSAHRQRVEAGGVLQDDLFGADDTALAFAAEEASYADGKRREALRALRRVNAALDKGDALDLKDDFAKSLGIQDPKNAEQLKAAANRLRETVTRWENYHTDPELYAEAHAYAKQALGIPDVVVERQDGTLTTDRELSADLHPEGTDALGGAPDAEGETSLRSIGPLYTGAGVAYERPSLVAVNSGEGAQVYGWGLYASDRPGVARSYAEDRRREAEDALKISYMGAPLETSSLSTKDQTILRTFVKNSLSDNEDLNSARDTMLQSLPDEVKKRKKEVDDLQNYVERLNKNLEDAKSAPDTFHKENDIRTVLGNLFESSKKLERANEELAIAEDWLSLLTRVDVSGITFEKTQPRSAIHEQTWWTHRAPGDESHLLKWHEPVSDEQRRWIEKAIRERFKTVDFHGQEMAMPEGKTNVSDDGVSLDLLLGKGAYAGAQTSGGNLYAAMKKLLGSPKAASEFLARAGIDGVKYPVNASRGGKGKDGWNYVAFSDEHLRVDRRRVWNGLDYEEDASFVPESGVLASPSPEGFRSEAPVSQAEIDAAANGPGFVPLEKGESLNRLEKQLRGIKDVPLRNERLGLTSSIATNNNVSKLSVVNRDGGENVEAHKFAMKNLQGIYANAKIGVRHRDKKLVGNKRSNGNYIRLFAPFRFDGQTYVALISQRESDVAPGVHAIEALEVVPLENNKAEGEPVYSSGHGRSSHFDGPATPVPSALTEEKVAYTLGDVNQTHPVYLDGRPCTPEGLLEDLQEMVTRFELGATRERVATGPSGSGDLAERTGTGEAGGVESTEGPATLDSRKSRVMIEEPKLIFGERVLPGKPYPMYGQVAPLGGAPGSPAREQGRIALGLPDLVMMYHELTGGHLPKVISNRARMGSALGRYFVGKNTIELAAQIFGFLDETDVIALHQRLEKEGYFRHMNPEWARTHDARTVKFERRRSEQKLKKEIQTLSKKRIREQHEGYREVSVMAHELWHLIDDQDGGLAKRGNLIGHLAALKKYTKEAFPVEGFASNRELMEEAKAFIPSWRGVTNPMDTAYFMNDPAETLAEIGGAYLTAPKALRERAPKLYDAWTFALAQHPKAQEAYDRAVAYIAGGEKAKRLAMMQGRTWTREAQRTMRALKNQATGTDHSLKRWRMRLNAYLWDRRGPAIMLYNEASRDSLKALRAELRKGVIGQADYEAAKARFGDGLAFLKKRHLDYTRLGSGLSRLYLADVRGELEARLAEVDPNPEIARAVMDEYAFNKRVLELKGRAAAYGTTVGDARAILNDMARTRGLDGMRKVATAWRTFRAIYEREVIENASVQRMLGPEAIDLMRANTSYVTMRHTLTPEQAGRLAKRLTDRKKANGAALEIALERLLPRGGEPGGAGAMNQLRQLKGSLQATESPLLATMKTAVGLITAAERNAAVADLAKALVDSGHVEARIVPWGEAVANMRHAPIEFWEGGEHKALMVPTIVARGFKESDDQTLKVLTHATRFINATFTTNNPGFVPRAQIKDFGSASLNIPGLWRMPVHYIDPVVGDVAALGLQFVPPHIMRKIGQTPVLKKFLNPHTVEYWNSFGNKMARMIHSADFVGALEEARRARASGNEAKARELEFLVQMCRSALRDGVLLNMIQFRRMEYDDSEWEALFARYNLDFDELPPEESRKLSPRQLPGAAWGLAKKGWNKIGDASEIASMTTKLGVYCYLHRDATPEMGDVTQAPSFADPLRRAVAAYRAATLAGDPTFELRGHLMTFIELTSGPFLNARQKGFLRAFDVDGKQPWLTDSGDFRMLSGPGQTAEKTLKVTAHFVRRFYYGALLAGGLSAATLGLYRLLTGNEEATEEEMEGTALGSLNTFFRWSEGVLRNCTPYTLLNFWTAPVWSKGDVSVVFCTPVSDEERVLNLLMDAALNQAGLPTINPTTGLSEVTEEVFGNLMNPLGGQGSLSEYRMLLASWLESQNPFDPFRNRPVLSEEEYAARWTEPNAAKTMAWRAVGASPLSLVLKPSDVRNDEIPAGPLRAFHAFVTRTPVLSSVLGGFLRFQIGGETARKRLVERADEQEVMRWKLRATNDYKEFAKTGGFTPPEDIPPDFVPDYEKRFIELINEAAARAKPGAKRREQLEEMAKSALRLRNPQLRAWQLRSLKRELELGE